MKQSIITIFLFLTISLALQAQDCKEKAKIARNNMDEGDDGLTCANAAEFYTKLCRYNTEPLTVEQGTKLKKELIAIKQAYNDYGVYCKDIDRIDDIILDSPPITLDLSENATNEESATTEDIVLEAVSNVSGSGNSSSGGGSSGNCNFAARDKFGDRSFSSAGAEHAANQYEGYRCHCINGTLQDGFTDPSFDPKPLDKKKHLNK